MAPVIGKAAPGFAGTAVMPDGSFKEVALGDFAGKWVVLYFYPLDFTFVCPTEICAFSDRAAEFEKLMKYVRSPRRDVEVEMGFS